jgi:transporter family protein
MATIERASVGDDALQGRHPPWNANRPQCPAGSPERKRRMFVHGDIEVGILLTYTCHMKNWILLAFISMFFAGLTSVIAKFGLKNITGDLGVAIRTSAVLIFVWTNALVFGHTKHLPALSKTDLLFLVVSGLTTSLSWIFYYKAIKIGEVSVVASIDKASLVVTILLSLWLLKEPLTLKMIAGVILIVAGTVVLAWK